MNNMLGFGKKKKHTITLITVKSDDMNETKFNKLKAEIKEAMSDGSKTGVFLVSTQDSIEISQVEGGE